MFRPITPTKKKCKRLESEKIVFNTELISAFVDIDPENNLLEDDDIDNPSDEDFNPVQTTRIQNR